MLVRPQPADRDRAFLGLALAHHQQQRHLGQAMLAHLVVDFLVAQVGLDPKARRLQLRHHIMGIVVGIRHDRRDHRLDRRQPQREAPGMMLDQNADEPLERPQNRPVKHDRPVPRAILADVRRVQPLGQHRVGLDRPHLPRPPDRVGQVKLQLGRIESPLAGQFLPAIRLGVAPARFDRIAE